MHDPPRGDERPTTGDQADDAARVAGDVTRILSRLEEDPEASRRLLPAVYDELRKLAEQRLRHEPVNLTLQATALVHEAYLRLVGDADTGWNGRGHFFGAAALAMRRILVERARRYGRVKHGAGRERVGLDDAEPGSGEAPPEGLERAEDVVALDAALRRLEAEHPERAQVVSLRYFAGLTIDQTADAMGLSAATVSRHWTCARAWLFQTISEQSPDSTEES